MDACPTPAAWKRLVLRCTACSRHRRFGVKQVDMTDVMSAELVAKGRGPKPSCSLSRCPSRRDVRANYIGKPALELFLAQCTHTDTSNGHRARPTKRQQLVQQRHRSTCAPRLVSSRKRTRDEPRPRHEHLGQGVLCANVRTVLASPPLQSLRCSSRQRSKAGTPMPTHRNQGRIREADGGKRYAGRAARGMFEMARRGRQLS
ncbi:uncharacterized protein J3D65DRAFT_394900 [Phyllosticta citribraziliensis]|uniref:Uncharacterized protein n=1 Tax=Phyllosticta citribraziliensis TaxID=989973 RepID=A0ABR1LL51_9PEZI